MTQEKEDGEISVQSKGLRDVEEKIGGCTFRDLNPPAFSDDLDKGRDFHKIDNPLPAEDQEERAS
jgi:hypothetical protein